MDEDIILAGHSLPILQSSLGKAVSAGPFRPGLVAPLLNVNGFSSRILLEKLGRLEAYEAKFGRCIQSCTETTVWTEPELRVSYGGGAASLIRPRSVWLRTKSD